MARRTFVRKHEVYSGTFEQARDPARTAHLAFRLDGTRHELAPAWRCEWIDLDVLSRLTALLSARSASSFYELGEHAESIVLVCLERDDYLRMRAAGAPIRAVD